MRAAVGRDADAHFLPYPYPYRWPLGPGDTAGETALALVRHALEDPASGIGPVAAMVVEPVQGNGGVVIPPDGFLAGLRELCDRHGAVLIFDEVQCGFGRTGRTWAAEHWGVVPDLMTVGKGIGGGLALSAVVGRAAFMAHWSPGTHTSTFMGDAVNLAAGSAAIGVLRDEGLVERSATVGARLLGSSGPRSPMSRTSARSAASGCSSGSRSWPIATIGRPTRIGPPGSGGPRSNGACCSARAATARTSSSCARR